ncbi:MAG: Asp-tRNA(Asn)/Glu-tRNA(Gln) amidotransferase subunit GatC [Anaerolineales bacterium]
MSLSLKEVEHIAKLARLDLTEARKALYREQLETILDHFARLQALDTSEVPPTTSGAKMEMSLREDIPRESLTPDELLKNAPQQDDGHFKIPPVFE